MAQLIGLPLKNHIENIFSEYYSQGSIYGLKDNKFYKPFPGLDISFDFNGRLCETPLGPAAGPHSQMAQNILLSFLVGGRFIELKTIQAREDIKITRPCIDIRNIGYNVEWSHEMKLEYSYREYVTAWILLKILEHEEILGIKKGKPFYNVIFDISVGYDLAGIQSPQIHRWIEGMRNASNLIDKILTKLPSQMRRFKTLSIDPHIANSTTLSTFHDCPAEEIEAIVKYLITEHKLHVIVKLNPTILGYDTVSYILQDKLGFRNVELHRKSFEKDLSFNQMIAIVQNLQKFAADNNRNIGVKLANSLVVKNTEGIFKDELRYLSGAPLHVIAIYALHELRKALGDNIEISFSGGIDKQNVMATLLCGVRPVTICTDLLKKGGYGRFSSYLNSVKSALKYSGCIDITGLTKKKARVSELNAAALKNTEIYVQTSLNDSKYHYDSNCRNPKKIDSKLQLFDCLTCDICLKVCPNAAVFSIPCYKNSYNRINLKYINGTFIRVIEEPLTLSRANQIMILADFCNDCGNCDTFCPEHEGPYLQKPRFFFSQRNFHSYHGLYGFYFVNDTKLMGYLHDKKYILVKDEVKGQYKFVSEEIEAFFDAEDNLLAVKAIKDLDNGLFIDMMPFSILKILFDSMKSAPEIYARTSLIGN